MGPNWVLGVLIFMVLSLSGNGGGQYERDDENFHSLRNLGTIMSQNSQEWSHETMEKC